MSAPINVITTGHDASGASVFVDGATPKSVGAPVTLLYGTQDGKPIDTNGDADLAAFAAYDPLTAGLLPKEGAVVVMAEWPAGKDGMQGMHRTLSVDIGVVLEGEVECHLDSGEHRLLKQGDVLIQRGTKHAWVNPSSTQAVRMMCFVLPSKPVEGAKE